MDNSGGGPAEAGGNSGHFVFSKYFTHQPVSVEPGFTDYSLPLQGSARREMDALAEEIGLGEEARSSIVERGFAVGGFTPKPDCEDVAEAYRLLSEQGLPILVTSGSLLHTYHVLFGHLLMTAESEHFYDDMWNLSSSLLEKCVEVHESSRGELREAARRDAAFLAVGLSLLAPEEDQVSAGSPGRLGGGAGQKDFAASDLERYSFPLPPAIRDLVREELRLIESHDGYVPSPIFYYKEDYTQYVPRGHYTTTEKLRNYFRAMMWYGRMTMLLKGTEQVDPGGTCDNCEALISLPDARIQTRGAMLLSDLMGAEPELMALWERVYRATSFFVGFSDDLGPYEYLEAMDEVLGCDRDPSEIDADDLGRLKAELAEYRSARIYGGTGECALDPPFTVDEADQCLAKTRGFRLMGQRFVPDSHILSRMVVPYMGKHLGSGMPFTAGRVPVLGVARVMPRGLDVMAAMGAERALELLEALGDTDYEDFDKAFREIKAEIDAVPASDWNQNLYWNWLWVLKSLTGQSGEGFPAFMRSDAWRDRLLRQALASWAELRHDTILYVKQS
jgi:hypothetical protein